MFDYFVELAWFPPLWFLASKETNEETTFPPTFLDQRGIRIKQALNIVRKFGCVIDLE